jgi:hypothetical protein
VAARPEGAHHGEGRRPRKLGPAAPDPKALRRDRPSDADGWTTLPADGRKGNAPAWPLRSATAFLDHLLTYDEDGKPTNADLVARIGKRIAKRELEVWRKEWKRPQAVMWERARPRGRGRALRPRARRRRGILDAPVNLRTLVKQHQESLGISLPGMTRNRWRIEQSAAAGPPAPRRRRASRPATASRW